TRFGPFRGAGRHRDRGTMTGDAPEILALTRHGRMGASSRVRIMQFAPYFEAAGLRLTIAPFVDDAYLAQTYAGRRPIGATLGAYLRRARTMARARPAAFWLQRECMPWVPWSVERALLSGPTPIVTDFDDAVFHSYDLHRLRLVRALYGRKIDRFMARADAVLAGNAYLADRARRAGAADVRIVPTVLDTDRYVPPSPRAPSAAVTVGWMGSPSTYKAYIAPRLDRLEALMRKTGARLMIVGAGPATVDTDVTTHLAWSEEGEVDAIQQMDIGIMPLTSDSWTLGKCGYKLLQYMACARAVVASPVGVNSEIVAPGDNGLFAESLNDWDAALTRLIEDADLRARLGAAGRRSVVARYSTQAIGPQITTFFRNLVAPAAAEFPPGEAA
ncbi:MAG: glycosyltransferase family 4 protein, partial [Pseudomonadota bacterium]